MAYGQKRIKHYAQGKNISANDITAPLQSSATTQYPMISRIPSPTIPSRGRAQKG
jgi:hypothetical protein